MNYSGNPNQNHNGNPARPVRSLLMIQLENEHRLLEVGLLQEILVTIFHLTSKLKIQHRQQIEELNRCMVAGQDLATAARRIFGPPVDRPSNSDIVNFYYLPPRNSNPASHSNPSNPNHPANRNHRYE